MTVAQYGSASVHRIIDLDPFALPLEFLFPGATLEALLPEARALAHTHIDFENGTVLLAVQSHLIRFAGKTILVDTCVGEHKERPTRPDWHRRAHTQYLANLKAAGCAADDIDFVMCTHLHADHVGWNTRLDSGRWVPTFANARYLMSQTEIDFRAEEVAASPKVGHGNYQDSVLPVLQHDRVTTVAAEDEIVDGATIRALPGHAPGQVGLELAAGKDEHVLFCGDAIHSPVQIFHPHWSSAFCHNPLQAIHTRLGLIERAVTENLRLIPSHLRGGSMRIRVHGSGFRPLLVP